MPSLNLNCQLATKAIEEFIVNELKKAGSEKAIIGLSGGLDSALVAYLAARAIGAENVHTVFLPYATSNPQSRTDAQKVAESLQTHFQEIEITPLVDAYCQTHEASADMLRKGNFMARIRMCILYDLSAKYRALVLGTGNKTEYLLGYSTIFGDSACAFMPIADLYKTQVRQLAAYLNVPQQIIDKAPSADLWEGQTDETELGLTYADADNILCHLIDHKMSSSQIQQELPVNEAAIQKIEERLRQNAFKRKLPTILHLTGTLA